MKKLVYLISLFTLMFIVGFVYKTYEYKDVKPNVIFILADDLGYAELGCYGNTFNETPNIDILSTQGVRFTNAYSSAPVCSPYRAALMTGQYPVRLGITDFLRASSDVFLDTTLVSLPKAFKKNGYHTGIIGKWHLSGYKSRNAKEEALPDKHGFDEVISSETAGIANGTYFYPYHFNPEMKKKMTTEKEFIVDRMNHEAVEFIEKNHQKPFFLYLSHYVVHTMLHGKPDLVDHFRSKTNCGKSSPLSKNMQDDPYKKWPSDYMAQKNNPHLAAQLKVLDNGVGMIRHKLKELGIDDNTIIVFTSDNGGETRVTDNAPLSGGKSMLYEGGIRGPLIIYKAGQIEGGRTIDVQTANYDFYPTLCELTGTEVPKSQQMDGISIAPVLLGKSDDVPGNRTFYWHYPLEKPHFLGGRSAGCIREGKWKLIEFFETGKQELYDLDADIGEKNELSYAYPEIVNKLQRKLSNWRDEVCAKIPEGQIAR